MAETWRFGEHGISAEPEPSSFAELLIDCEEDRTLRAVLVGMLREMEAWSGHLWSPRDVVAWPGSAGARSPGACRS